MSLDGDAVEALYKNFVVPAERGVRIFLPPGWAEKPPDIPTITPLTVGTLSAVVDYLKFAPTIDTDQREGLFVHVEGPGKVAVKLSLETVTTENRYRRSTLLVATTDLVGLPPIQWGTYYEPEMLIVALQAWFVDDADRAKVLALIGNIRDAAVTTSTDDGISQSVTAARGVSMRETQTVPNPVELRPYRTFREVDQPRSRFVLRAKAGKELALPSVALFEADGLKWKLDAMQSIKDYLNDHLQVGVPVLT